MRITTPLGSARSNPGTRGVLLVWLALAGFTASSPLPATQVAPAVRGPAAGVADPEPPLDIDLQEHVDVQLVLIDAVVMNRKDETIGGLEIEDFDLLVDHKLVDIATLDVDCPTGGSPDAPVNATRMEIADKGGFRSTRRYIFVLDYYHLATTANEVLDRMRVAVERLNVPGEEYMLMSLGQVLRVEVPFTDDPQEVVRGIDRMVRDAGLYFGFYERLTERRWYDRILTMLDLMETIPGRKSVVLFSGPFLADGWFYDNQYNDIAAMAARSRTAFYPVDSRGLVLSSIMGPTPLRRLAVETGGRMTAGTNDLARGFARAQRDEGCRYTLGFYDDSPRLDKERKVRLVVREGGLHVVHPTYYVLRSREAKRKSRVRAASMVPTMFETPDLAANLFLVRPETDSRWETLAAIEVEPQVFSSAPPGTVWTLRGSLSKLNGTVKNNLRFQRELAVPEADSGGESTALTVFQSLRARPGRYTLNVVLSNPASDEPFATTREVVVPPIPRNEVFMVGPLLGRDTGGATLGARRGQSGLREGEPLTVQPLLEMSAVQGEQLATLTTVCFVGDDVQPGPKMIRRLVTSEDGRSVEAFEPVPMQLEEGGKVRCHTLRDEVATANLRPGYYNIRAFSQNGVDPTDGGIVEFSVVSPAAESAP